MVIFQKEDSNITSPESTQDVIIYDNSNIQKSCSGVTTPLTYNFTKRVYASVYKCTFRSLSLSEAIISKNEDVFQNLIGIIKGRIYYNVTNWYKGLQLFHPFDQNKAALAHMLGLSDPVNVDNNRLQSWKSRFLLLWLNVVELPRVLIAFVALKSRVPRFLSQVQTYFNKFYRLDLQGMDIEGLKKIKFDLDTGLTQWTTPVINDLYILMTCDTIANLLRKAGVKNAREIVKTFLDEEEAVARLSPARRLHQLAIEASYNPELRHLLNELPDDIDLQVMRKFGDFHEKIQGFIDYYGDRTVGELKLETETMRSNTQLFYNYLKDCLNAQISEIRASGQYQQKACQLLEGKLAHLPLTQKSRIMAKVAKLQIAAANRETFKLERSRAFGMYRSVYIAIGQKLVATGFLDSADDVFYLTEDEIMTFGNGSETIYKGLVEVRRTEYQTYQSEETPSRVFVSATKTSAKSNLNLAVIKGIDLGDLAAEVA